EIQDKIRRRLIWVLIFSPYPNLKLSIQKETRVEGRVSRGNRSSRDTLITRHSVFVTRPSLAPDTRNLKPIPPVVLFAGSSAATEILVHHLLLLLPSLFFLFFNPDP